MTKRKYGDEELEEKILLKKCERDEVIEALYLLRNTLDSLNSCSGLLPNRISWRIDDIFGAGRLLEKDIMDLFDLKLREVRHGA